MRTLRTALSGLIFSEYCQKIQNQNWNKLRKIFELMKGKNKFKPYWTNINEIKWRQQNINPFLHTEVLKKSNNIIK